ncbi:MAG: hypothetical protein ACAF42_00035 (plasmid) [Limnothrix sp. BL-A-16]|jgi:hypothetical protein
MDEVKNIWIQYVASQDHPLPEGAESVMRLPFGGFTWLLSEEWSFTGKLPNPGDRPRLYRTNYADGGDDMQSRLGDWVVEAVDLFISTKPTEYEAIAVCTCRFAPVPQQEQVWREVPRASQPVLELEPA